LAVGPHGAAQFFGKLTLQRSEMWFRIMQFFARLHECAGAFLANQQDAARFILNERRDDANQFFARLVAVMGVDYKLRGSKYSCGPNINTSLLSALAAGRVDFHALERPPVATITLVVHHAGPCTVGGFYEFL
jgi:hypothetical protein